MLLILISIVIFSILVVVNRASSRSRDILYLQHLRLFSNGILEYDIIPEKDTFDSLFDDFCCLCRDSKKQSKCTTIRINLSHNLEIKKQNENTLQLIDVITKQPLSNFPGTFSSDEQMETWKEQMQEIIKFAKSYS